MKLCLICNEDITNTHHNCKYCKPCSRERRKNLFKIYDKNRKTEDKLKNRQKANEKRRSLRKMWKENNLCSECGSSCFEKLSRCYSCHNINLKACMSYSRRKGALPSGSSRPELFVFEVLSQIISPQEIIRNTWKIIRSPITNSSLELDLYLPSLSLAIEVDGPMHREPCYGQQRLEAQLLNDKIKDEQCLLKGIKLIRINTDLISEDYVRATLSEAVRIARNPLVVQNVQRLTVEELIQ